MAAVNRVQKVFRGGVKSRLAPVLAVLLGALLFALVTVGLVRVTDFVERVPGAIVPGTGWTLSPSVVVFLPAFVLGVLVGSCYLLSRSHGEALADHWQQYSTWARAMIVGCVCAIVVAVLLGGAGRASFDRQPAGNDYGRPVSGGEDARSRGGDVPPAVGDATGRTTADTATGHRLFFVDPADIDRVGDESATRAYASISPGDRSFVLFCGPFESDDRREAVERIVETEKPAHVDARVFALKEAFALGEGTFLGLNSALQTRSFAMGEAALGEDTVLGSPESN